MKVTKYEINALENLLGCMRHYVSSSHITEEYTKKEVHQIERSIRRIESLLHKMEDSYLNE
jgi:hypothetical protein